MAEWLLAVATGVWGSLLISQCTREQVNSGRERGYGRGGQEMNVGPQPAFSF